MLPVPKIVESFMNSMITTDDPMHRRLRKLVAKAFTPKTVAALRPSIEAKTAQLFFSTGTSELSYFFGRFAGGALFAVGESIATLARALALVGQGGSRAVEPYIHIGMSTARRVAS